MIALVGANGVGKTTLARAFAEANAIHFVETTVSATYKAIGCDPAVEYDIATRVAIQTVVLEEITRQYEAGCKTGLVWIADRSPIDLAAYMLADVQRTTCNDPEVSAAVLDYVQKCIEVANRFFSVLVLVQPGIKVELMREGKAPSAPAFQEHFNALAFGLLMDERLMQRHYFIKRSFTDPKARQDCLTKIVIASVDRFREANAAETTVKH